MITALAVENALATVPIVPSDINILILDDCQFDRIRIRRMFESLGIGFHLREVETIDTLEACLDSQEFDIVLIDYQLPQGNGIEALEQIQNHPKNRNAIMIMIAGDDQSQIAVTALNRGCQDYVAKDALTASRLGALVTRAVEGIDDAKIRTPEILEELEDFACREKLHDSCVLQPKVAKIIHDIRALRARMYQPQNALAQELAAVEKGCLGLWSSLMETGTMSLDNKGVTGPT